MLHPSFHRLHCIPTGHLLGCPPLGSRCVSADLRQMGHEVDVISPRPVQDLPADEPMPRSQGGDRRLLAGAGALHKSLRAGSIHIATEGPVGLASGPSASSEAALHHQLSHPLPGIFLAPRCRCRLARRLRLPE